MRYPDGHSEKSHPEKNTLCVQMSQMCERIIFIKFLLKLNYEQLKVLLVFPN